MKLEKIIENLARSQNLEALVKFCKESTPSAISLSGLAGSAPALVAAAANTRLRNPLFFILGDRESASYFFNDLENLLGQSQQSYENRSVFFFPSSFRKPFESKQEDNANILLRSEVMNRLASQTGKTLIVTYPEALCEKVVSRQLLKKNTLSISVGERISLDFLLDVLVEYGFERVDFVVEPGTFSLRGGIIDVFSFSNDYPFRIEFFGEKIESLRTFNPENQLSVKRQDKISILPDIALVEPAVSNREILLDSLPANTLYWCDSPLLAIEKVKAGVEKLETPPILQDPDKEKTHYFSTHQEIEKKLGESRLVEFHQPYFSRNENNKIVFSFLPQPTFNKNFELLAQNIEENQSKGFFTVFLSDNPRQIQRIDTIFETISKKSQPENVFNYTSLLLNLHQGFIDLDLRIAFFTDHQIFDRYHRFKVRDKFAGKQALTIKEFQNLKPGDYVTHIDHGIGVFSGLEKIEVNGRIQEAIRLIYKNDDVLYVNIHSLHRVSRYSGKDGVAPTINRLGSSAWANLKKKTKSKVKDIAKDLIRLYAQRRAREGFAFSPDTYLQTELEASFIYEDTPDQETATINVKKDMEAQWPMDRLICGDVGFGKTEVAIRAAFKAVADSKQVAVLVPTTILALQHYNTFSDRLKDFPCRVDYISRFRSAIDKTKILKDLENGKIDIIIGTHRLVSKDVKFKDLGLLIIDEEQKFGVTTKEKLKQFKVNVDTLTLTATPIPRTLQFSLMGARDFSQINTPPPNRYPIVTELHVFNKELIRDAINNELARGGQVFFVHNRVQNIAEIARIVKTLCPEASVAIGHGQLDGETLEKTMIDFINGEYDVLVATTIIESGLDIPNANTILINNAHHFGLSDLHQMRGRVGRTNKKAFCYLFTPPVGTLSEEARKRLRAIEEFSALGSGLNIALRDLDIRGAGNLLGAEQSGFIAEVGLEMYQKILDEAIIELKETEFRDLFTMEIEERAKLPAECVLETDLELLLPSDYISNVEERLFLYKELDTINHKEKLVEFENQIADRFGQLPEQTVGLLKAIEFRWMARQMGFEKIILKNKTLIGYFISNQESPYYKSETFERILSFAQNNPRRCLLKETSDKLSLTVKNIQSIENALRFVSDILG